MISVIVACRVANGPSMTMTESPTLEVGDLAFLVSDGRFCLSVLLPRLGREDLHDLVEGQRHRLVGVADEAGDPGVCRTAAHDSSVRSMRTRT